MNNVLKHKTWIAIAACAALALGGSAVKAAGSDYDENPMPVKTPPPEYPTEMKAQHRDGMVLLTVSLSQDGTVEQCEVKKSTSADFEAPAVNAVKTWKFKPAVKDGAAVPAKILLPIKFNHEA